jgi:hypothetical protein
MYFNLKWSLPIANLEKFVCSIFVTKLNAPRKKIKINSGNIQGKNLLFLYQFVFTLHPANHTLEYAKYVILTYEHIVYQLMKKN